MIKSNFHTHTVYCDGNNTPREMVESAIALGFTHLGFSGHSYFPYDKDVFMTPEILKDYKREVLGLKEEYKGRIKILYGIEWDLFSPEYEGESFDYAIGSVHALKIGGSYYPIDLDAKETRALVDRFFDGYDGFAEAYFETVKRIPREKKVDIIGHIDLCSKYSEIWGEGESPRYLAAAESAVRELCSYGIPFEINTGAMSRGYRTTPYPSPAILRMIKKYGGGIVISSDCHSKGWLDFGFDEAVALAREVGFEKHGVLEEDGIKYYPL